MKLSSLGCRRWALCAALLFSLLGAGCSSPAVQGPVRFFKELTMSSGERRLNEGVANYDDGDYKAASKDLQSALDLGLDPKQKAEAHKYLAFMRCTTRQQLECRNHFRQAFEADPQFQLGAAEVGNPIWGPIYRSVKLEPASKTKQR
jgi:Tfp pilus assembly protein PilF